MHFEAASSLIVLMAHPDDEFALFPVLDDASRRAVPIHLLWLSDGSYGGQDPMVRVEESRRVLGKLGIVVATADFVGLSLGVPDGRVVEHLAELESALLPRLASLPADALLLCPAWEGGHQDHDAIHLLGRRIARRTGRPALQYPLYQGEGLPGPIFRVLAPLRSSVRAARFSPRRAERLRYALACLGYRSQRASFIGLLPMIVLRSLVCMRDWFLLELRADAPPARPHPGPLLYERRTDWSWRSFSEAAGDYLA
jgi:hypothetical protein